MSQKKARTKIFHLIFLTAIVLSIYMGFTHLLPFISTYVFKENTEASGLSTTYDLSNALVWQNELYSSCAILIDMEKHEVLAQKNCESKMYPASLTKMMTAILAIECLPNENQKILLAKDIFEPLYLADASMAGFMPQEEVKAIDLIYGILLPSGAEAAMGLAEYIAGSEEGFVALMNKKARDLGMYQTHFTNVVGFTDPMHYTTAKDMALLLTYALKNKTFREAFTSPSHTTAPTNMHETGLTFYSTMFQKLPQSNFNGTEILGGKTGFTEEAGLCLASLAQREGKEYILITTGAPGNAETDQYNLLDAVYVYSNIPFSS